MGLLDAFAALVRAGYPEETARKIASGELPMDTASRMARAADQGYDPSKAVYHGTSTDFLDFIESPDGSLGPGVYLTPEASLASSYANEFITDDVVSGAQVMPLLVRGESIPFKDLLRQNPDAVMSDLYEIGDNYRRSGITSTTDRVRQVAEGAPQEVQAVFDPRDIRSYFSAAFDPDYSGPNILGGVALPVVGGLLAAGQSEDADAGTLSKAAKIAALRAEANAARFGDEVDVSYRGAHVAPTADYGAPLHNLTSIIPEDVYGADGPRLYGLMDRAVDDEAFAVLRAVRGNPDAEVTMYRAVPVDAPETIADGDWVTTSRAYANQHGERALGGNYKILEEPTYARRLQSEGYPYEFGYMKNGRATVPILTATAGGTGAALAAPGLINMAADEPLEKPTAGDVMDSVFNILDMPMAGLQGLVRTGYGLATGESLLDALAEGVHITQQGPDYGADRFEQYITEKTGDPSLGWMGKMGLLFGAPF